MRLIYSPDQIQKNMLIGYYSDQLVIVNKISILLNLNNSVKTLTKMIP